MRVFHLIVQRKVKWGGEREVWASADQYTMDENPAYMDEKIQEVIGMLGTEDEDGKEFTAYGVVSAVVPDEAIDSVLMNWLNA